MNILKFFLQKLKPYLWFYKAIHEPNNLAYIDSRKEDNNEQDYSVSSIDSYFPIEKIAVLEHGLPLKSIKNLRHFYPYYISMNVLRRMEHIVVVPFYTQKHKHEYMDFCLHEKVIFTKSGFPRRIVPESAYFHHGLRNAAKQIKKYISGKIFIDGGACYGDSAFAFLQYSPKKVYSFEISPKIAKKFTDFMRKNSIGENQVCLIRKGLGDKKENIFFCDDYASEGTSLNIPGQVMASIIPLDESEMAEEHIGFIKLDVEGFGLKAVKGMTKIICRDRPVLSIAVYHTEEELFEIKPYLESLGLDYRIEFDFHSFNKANELVLFAYPKELQEISC